MMTMMEDNQKTKTQGGESVGGADGGGDAVDDEWCRQVDWWPVMSGIWKWIDGRWSSLWKINSSLILRKDNVLRQQEETSEWLL